MDIIHLLPDSVANQIAAGEVIQRPASCIKELVENSLDAGATSIHVLVWDAGKTSIQVIDNGKGMSETDARMAFERHATSKIASAQDLFALHTMGFRGEALASICAVAQVELTTRREEDEIGTKIEMNGSELVTQEPCTCSVGTNFKVKNLFFNVPARRRFLKTDATELRNIITEFYRMVLVNPQCQFTLVSNDEILLDLPAGTSKQRIEQVFGKSTNKQFTSGLVEIKTDTELASIRGFVGKPEFASKNHQQFFFVNNRYMRHPYFHKAVLSAYQGMLQGELQPSYFIYFDVNPELIDVNIHPTKTEIKFADEQAIWPILQATVREALGKFNVVPSLDFEEERVIDIPLPPTEDVQRPEIAFNPNYNPFASSTDYNPWETTKTSGSAAKSAIPAAGYNASGRSGTLPKTAPAGWEKLYASAGERFCAGSAAEEDADLGSQMQLFDDDLSSLTPYQFANKYILLPAHGGLLVIDQHRAHVKVLYEQMCRSLRDFRGMTQEMLFPDVIELTHAEMQVAAEAMEDLQWVGFHLEQFSPTAYSIEGIPAILTAERAVTVLYNILHSIRECGTSARNEWRNQMALAIAEDSAVPYGRAMGDRELRELVDKLFALDNYARTPKGKQILNVLPMGEIEKLL